MTRGSSKLGHMLPPKGGRIVPTVIPRTLFSGEILPLLRARWAGPAGWWRGPVLVALAYYLGAEAAFFIGTLSDKIFALFWPPNVILFCALVIAPQRHWWRYIAAAFVAHVVAELGVGMPAGQLL